MFPASLKSDRGFTLIELLVVILILGILLAIALPTFLGQDEQAKETDAKTQLNTAYKVARADAVDRNGGFGTPAEVVSAITASEPQISSLVAADEASAPAGQVSVISSSGGNFHAAYRTQSGRVCRVQVANRGKPNITCAPAVDGRDPDPGGGDPGPGPGTNAAKDLLVQISDPSNMGANALYRVADDGNAVELVFDKPAGETDPVTTLYFGQASDTGQIGYYAQSMANPGEGSPCPGTGTGWCHYTRLGVLNADGSPASSLSNPCPANSAGTRTVTAVDLSPDADTLYVGCFFQEFDPFIQEQQLYAVDVASDDATRIAAADPAIAGGVIDRLLVSPDGAKLAFRLNSNSSAPSGLYTLDISSSSLVMAVPASDIDANIVGSTGRPTWTPSGGLAYFDGSTGDADSTFGFPLDRLHLITAGADGSSPATVDAGGSPASSLIGGGLPTLISDRAAFVCVDDMSSYSSQNKICVTKNNAAIESFTVAHGTVLNLEYVVGE